MNEKRLNDEFFKLLLLNDEEKIKNYVFNNGKQGKEFCPISFEKKDEKGGEVNEN